MLAPVLLHASSLYCELTPLELLDCWKMSAMGFERGGAASSNPRQPSRTFEAKPKVLFGCAKIAALSVSAAIFRTSLTSSRNPKPSPSLSLEVLIDLMELQDEEILMVV